MGDTILGNRYEIIRKIGDGGMAFVYEAKDRLLNRTVALKVLRPEFVDDDEFLTKFKREAEAVASLSHPNIVNVYDVGEDGKVHYIVMEFVDGKNLKEIIQDEGILDEYTALDITKQIAMALSAAHKKGIIHRDIKPHNILISNEGRVVKVADFGIAKAVSNSTMTNIGSIIGSVHYFSPEQAKGKFVTNNADLYSLGIVLYEMLIGKVPFRGDSPISIALQHINDDIDFTSEEKVRIPQSVRTTIKKLTEKSSADRYQTAEELIEDIDYIEKNIDLDFIKEYDDFATKKIDEKEISKAVNPVLAKPVPEKVVKPIEVADLDEDDDFYEEDEDEEEIMRAKKNQKPKNTQSKRAKKKKKKQESPKARKRLKVVAAVLIVILCAQVFLAYKFLFAGGFGSKDLTVPNLVNMTLEEAQSEVEKEGLSLSVKSEEYSSEVDKNCIISQTPEGGSTNIKKGDTINVVVSKGANEASVPNVVGITLTNAKKVIEENKLKVGTVKYEYSSVYKEGTVLSQSPSSGSSSVQEGDEIDLYVSKGPEKSNTPTPTTPNKTPTTPNEDDTTTPGSNSGNSGGNSGGSNSGNSGGSSGGSNSGNNGGNSGNNGDNSGNSGDNSGNSGGNSGNNGDNSGGSNSGNSGDNSGGSNSGNTGETPSGTGGNIGKSE
ncbi:MULTISPECIES: Stk1 family PASTA domain-containing Ser/Thr kinase [unclassified Clostridioides]|uniref:Stk1 family PASTA domain-containing Ser/Thr kinase n=1 Tax=unclassified Clostridioides TaxID=2635829 RepID=UPI001D11B037|nr:Stk1 family PASTA domain-containing Ser/Thr kinase [Clostridioides sp. ZZV14-6150]MCC0660057.1 Stk1 family PASTA domain-containing Ser/Thr kinase [Clostridioides sp. ZZV14-6154]MCC0667245.1 Stk1 family PASTA domain-containing Ser/Thr kinase [Clostridioides sp. ZZV14-6153]MCC0717259.1 Stk1 family PASTA domain-containing Ser/Thr kinase [Clostridioides sp. ZZV14-6105]MCC0721144.1 Stk1 family PASTA domain-containing Ser/Thr kinase [Clostridioides sp. ZZV14-6104]MCC0726889.1 Stk1 family PASTA do